MVGKTGRWILAVALLLGLIAVRGVAIHTESINWDEFALLNSAAHTAETGVLHGGGRPGLAVLALAPIVADCTDEIASVHAARWVWLGLGIAFLIGFAVVLRQVGPATGFRNVCALLGVALLALTPAYMQWSLQVRTDLLALAIGVWGAAALLASHGRPALSIVAGVLFGAAYLASQKLLYLAALAGLLAMGDLWLRESWRWRREIARGTTCLVAMAGAIAIYPNLLTVEYHGPPLLPGARAVEHVLKPTLSVFDFYRETLGFSQFRGLLPGLIPHGIVLVGLVFASVLPKGNANERRRLIIAWAILALGAVVLWFHAARFYYFWMTLGMFPAAAAACAYPVLRERCSERFSPAVVSAIAFLFWGVLGIQSVRALEATTTDTQEVQRRSLAFVARNFSPVDAGFHPESALFCRRGEDPFPTYFSQHIYFNFGGDGRLASVERMKDRFRAQPVKYLVESFRLSQFPPELREFWSENYHPYLESVRVAGRWIEEEAGAHSEFELVAAGRYRWLPVENAAPLRVDGRWVPPGGVVDLHAGRHRSAAGEAGVSGLLVLALAEPPETPFRPFYRTYP